LEKHHFCLEADGVIAKPDLEEGTHGSARLESPNGNFDILIDVRSEQLEVLATSRGTVDPVALRFSCIHRHVSLCHHSREAVHDVVGLAASALTKWDAGRGDRFSVSDRGRVVESKVRVVCVVRGEVADMDILPWWKALHERAHNALKINKK
jgi:hypothetical protein